MNLSLSQHSSELISSGVAGESAALDGVAGEPIEPGFIARVLSPYRHHCTYLKRAWFEQGADGDDGLHGLVMHGEFGIGESCYIDDTGHFNAVEFNICYNQVCYLYLAHCIRNGLVEELDHYDLAGFYDKQLSNVLIVDMSSRYKSVLNPRKFYGEFRIRSARRSSRATLLKTGIAFRDDSKVRCLGEVSLAVMHPTVAM